MNRYQILIEYVGTSYIGWQTQKKGNSIQKTIQNFISKLLKENIKLHGSGRTDKGVHALEQSAHFDYQNKIKDINKLIKSLNFFLNKMIITIRKTIKPRGIKYSGLNIKEKLNSVLFINISSNP